MEVEDSHAGEIGNLYSFDQQDQPRHTENQKSGDGRLSPQKRPCVLSVLRLFAGKRDLSGAVRAL